MQRSQSPGILPPLNPVNPMLKAFDSRPPEGLETLGEHPLPLIPNALSPGGRKLRSCSANTPCS